MAKAGTSPPRMIYFNIGWMTDYRGATERTRGAQAYLKAHEHGAESFNFLEANGHVFGYRPGHRSGIDIKKLGASPGADAVDDVLVAWMAREPQSKSMFVVGWYSQARVWARPQSQAFGARTVNGEEVLYSAETVAKNARLLPPLARQFEVFSSRSMPGGFGQSPIWYGTDAFNGRTWRFIQEIEGNLRAASKPKANKPPARNSDPELRRQVEKAAVDHAIAFYQSPEGGNCTVTSVERDAIGWDLTVERPDGSELFVEVKGLQGSELVCELTPNEYKQMRNPERRDRYVVYVVRNALTQPLPTVFHHQGENQFATVDGRSLNVEERLAAILRSAAT